MTLRPPGPPWQGRLRLAARPDGAALFSAGPAARAGEAAPLDAYPRPLARIAVLPGAGGAPDRIEIAFERRDPLPGWTAFDVMIETLAPNPVLFAWDAGRGAYVAAVPGAAAAATRLDGAELGFAGLPVADPAATRRWRLMMLRADDRVGLRPNAPQLWPWGDMGPDACGQMVEGFAQSADGLRLLWSGDSHGMRRTDDFGETFGFLKGRGIVALCFTGVAFDPDDASVGWADGGPSWMRPDPSDLYGSGGLWRWEDDAERGATLCRPRVYEARNTRGQSNMLSVRRAGPGDWRTRSIRWLETSTRAGEAPILHRSEDGGQSWAESARMPAEMSGRYSQLLVNPHDPSELFVAAGSGLWRLAADGAGPVDRVASLPGGDCARVWIDPEDPRTALAALFNPEGRNGGLWHSADGMASWTRVLELAGLTFFVVGPTVAGRRALMAFPAEASGNPDRSRVPHVQSWALGTTPSAEVARPGRWAETGWSLGAPEPAAEPLSVHQTRMLGGRQIAAVAHPTDPARALVWGYGLFWATFDGGRTWRIAGTGWNTASISSAHMAPDGSPSLAAGLVDCELYESANQGLSFGDGSGRITPAQRTTIKRVCETNETLVGVRVLRLPETAGAGAGGRVIAAIGPDARTCVAAYRDAGAPGWTLLLDDPVVGRPRRCVFIGSEAAHPWIPKPDADPLTVYWADSRSADGGASFSFRLPAGHQYVGVSNARAGRVYVLGADDATILVSPDRGATLAPWALGLDLRDVWRGARFRLSPFDDRVAAVRGPRQDIRLIGGEDRALVLCEVRLIDAPAYADLPPANYEAVGWVWSEIEPRTLYVSVSALGWPRVWEVTFSEDWRSVARLTDLTLNLPLNTAHLRLSALANGDLIAAGSSGWVLPPSGGPRARSVWAWAPEA